MKGATLRCGPSAPLHSAVQPRHVLELRKLLVSQNGSSSMLNLLLVPRAANYARWTKFKLLRMDPPQDRWDRSAWGSRSRIGFRGTRGSHAVAPPGSKLVRLWMCPTRKPEILFVEHGTRPGLPIASFSGTLS